MLKLLLDTHIFLWAILEKNKLRRQVITDLLENRVVEKYLSAASSWEIALKYAKGHLILPDEPKIFVPTRMRQAGIKPLPITHQDTLLVGELPEIHKDPFDRLLIVQANINNLSVLSDDDLFGKYAVNLIRADQYI
jgi:PIN domain nuclease of toxin-antitoxin system